MRVVVLTSNFNLAANIAVKSFLENKKKLKKYDIEIVGLVCASTVGIDKRSIRLSWKFLRKSGLNFFFKIVGINAWQYVKLKVAKIFFRRSDREFLDFDEMSSEFKVPLLNVGDVNSQGVVSFIKSVSGDVLVSCHLLQILKKNILDIPELGSINFHPALLQKHRGSFTGFWALFKKWKTSGATVHYMTEKLDDGEVIVQRNFFIKPDDSIFCVNKKNAIIGSRLLAKALIKIKKKQVRVFRLSKLGKMLSMPSESQVRIFEKKGGGVIRWRDVFKI